MSTRGECIAYEHLAIGAFYVFVTYVQGDFELLSFSCILLVFDHDLVGVETFSASS